MTIDDVEIYDFLEHFGVKGMHWGVRKAASRSVSKAKSAGSSVRKTVKEHPTAAKRIAVGAAFAGAVIAAGAAGKAIGGRNKIPVKLAKDLSNDRAARILINEGHRFTKSANESTLLFNSARQVKEGLRDKTYVWNL